MLISGQAPRSATLIDPFHPEPTREADIGQTIRDCTRTIANPHNQGVVTNLFRQFTDPIHSRIHGFELSGTQHATIAHPCQTRTWTRVDAEGQIPDVSTLGNDRQTGPARLDIIDYSAQPLKGALSKSFRNGRKPCLSVSPS